MEARKITIVSTKNQKKSVIMSSATTLAELKADLRNNNIDYSGMTFYEGTSKTELKTDDSILPTNVPYKGTVTNELVFMLTNTAKKIRSGATISTRIEAYSAIKAAGLQQACIDNFGKNFTMCKTADLIALVEGNSKKASAKKSAPKTTKPIAKKEVKKTPIKKETPKVASKKKVASTPTTPATPNNSSCGCSAAISKLVKALVGTCISYETANSVLAEIGEKIDAPKVNTKTSTYSDSEISAMFKGVC